MACAGTAALVAQTRSVHLALALEPGQRCGFSLTTTTTVTMQVPMMKNMETVTVRQAAFDFTVLAADDSSFTLRGVYKSMAADTQAPGVKETFGCEGDDPLSQACRTLIDKPFTAVLSRTGKVLAVSDTDSLYTGMDRALKAYGAKKRARYARQVQLNFGPAAIEDFIASSLADFPDKRVKLQQVWRKKEVTEQGAVTMTMEAQSRLKELEDTRMLIEIDAIFTTEGEAPELQGGLVIKDLYGNGKGTLLLERPGGWTLQGDISHTINGTAGLRNQDLSIPMTITTRTLISPLPAE